MAFSVLDTSGATVTLDKGAIITSIGGRSVNVILTGMGAEATAMRRRGRILSGTPITIAPFAQINPSTLAFEYGTPATVLAQAEEIMMDRWDASGQTSITGQIGQLYGTSLAPKSEVDLYFNNADISQSFGILFAKAMDPPRALTAGGMYTVNRVSLPRLTKVQTNKGEVNAGTPTPNVLTCIKVNQNAQYEIVNGIDQQCGDAVIIVSRDQATQAQLESADYFTISYLGQKPARYTIWNQNGIRYMDAYYYAIYLERMK